MRMSFGHRSAILVTVIAARRRTARSPLINRAIKMTKTILVVDDSRVSRMMIEAHIENIAPDLHIFEAADADEALIVARRDKPDGISLDYNMPGIDGLTLANHLREYPDQRLHRIRLGIPRHALHGWLARVPYQQASPLAVPAGRASERIHTQRAH